MDILDKDGEPNWGVTSMLSSAEIMKNTLYYSFSPSLKRKLYNPRYYAKIKLSIQNKFGSKYALALYEIFVDYYTPRSLMCLRR